MSDFNIIDFLNKLSSLKIECPECHESFSVKDANLFDIRQPHTKKVSSLLRGAQLRSERELQKIQRDLQKSEALIVKLKDEKIKIKNKKAVRPKQIKIITKRVNIGQIMEKVLPSMKGFKFETKDCRALLTPIDYISFDGLTKNGKIEKVSFLEVKTGEARLTKEQKNVAKAIDDGKIEVRTY